MATSNLLKNKGSLQFEDKWDFMRPIVLKLLRQESVTKQQWFDLFSDVHAVCLWDDKGPAKIHQALKEDILEFIKQAQAKLNTSKRGTLLHQLACLSHFHLHRPIHPFIQQILSACCVLWQASSLKSFAIEEGKTSSTLIVKVFHLADLWGEISMDLEVVLISGKIQELMACGKKFFSSRKLAKGDREYKLMECCVNALVTSFKETILAECQGMIKRNETEKLHLMFSLMDKVPNGIEPMLKDLEEHIISAGLADMVAAAETITTDSEKYVEQLLTLFNRFSKLVKEAFQDDPRFLTARDKAYKAVVNDATIFKLELPLKQKGVGLKTQPESKCPELLANYCDMLLRKTPLSKKLTSEEIEAKLKEVLLVLKYVQNKDVFMRYHKAHLTRRLILDISADSEIEENMVEWLREVGMPADYVNKLARMFQDIKVSEDLNQAFKEMHKNNKLALPADSVNIKILNAGAWSRSSEKVFVSLPTELEDLIPEVEEFYKKNHSGRKLHWHHLMSNGIITFKNEVGQYDLEVTTFQLAVLFAWNQRPREKISFENLKLATELPDAELRRTLWSLVAFPKLKRQVLLYEPQVSSPKDFTEGTLFSVNQEFSLIKNAKVQKRGKINLIGRLQLTTERMREEENEGIVQLRILRTQEAIIQIMKMRKKISNAQLQTELVEILKNMFLPQKKMIKEQIEWLIEHKYIRRDESDINTFIYMA
uniref:Cullin-5 n=1 Tax=Callorhinus ursinus TaxID=34884 RepID=A0A3Q7QU38_CALUR|nr:cullin-5 [Callorhinus ursinus]